MILHIHSIGKFTHNPDNHINETKKSDDHDIPNGNEVKKIK